LIVAALPSATPEALEHQALLGRRDAGPAVAHLHRAVLVHLDID